MEGLYLGRDRLEFCAAPLDVSIRRYPWWVERSNEGRYNSAFYSSIAANSYEVFFMTGDYASYRADQGMPPDGSAGRYDMSASAARLEELVGMTPGAGTLELLDPGACLNAYARPLVTDRSNLIVVTKGESEGLNGTALIREKLYNFPSSIANGRTQYDPYGWSVTLSHLSRNIPLTNAGFVIALTR